MATDFFELAERRFSVRSYTDAPVEQDKLDMILEAGRIAPTANNQQPQRVYVLKSKEALKKLDSITPMRYGAPIVFLFTYDKNKSWASAPGGDPYDAGGMDVCIICTHMMLEAENLGLGTLWVRYFNADQVKKTFDLPDNEVVMCMLCLGHKAPGAKPSGSHSCNKPLSETVTYL